jgi:hypothetical protein
VLNNKGIPASYLGNKAALEYIIKTASANVESSNPEMPESQRKFFISQGLMSADEPKPNESKFCKYALDRLIDMLCGSKNANKQFTPEKVAGFINAHIKFNNGVTRRVTVRAGVKI